MTNTSVVLSVQGLTQKYGDFTAVKNLSFEVQQGEIYGFLGPNGAGKSTTIRTILDFIRPHEGQVTLFGLDSVQNSKAIRQRIGYLSSELVLWENWTGLQYIHWLESVHKKPLIAEARHLADRLNYDLDRKQAGMSTGMKRKMGIIATLVHKPEMLIFDEPTIGLDPLMQKIFEEIMLEVKDEGRTVFLSSHQLQEVESICDRVAIIRSGELQAIHRIAELGQLSFRWLTLKAQNGNLDMQSFKSIAGVSDVQPENGHYKMRVGGDTNMNQLIKHIAQYAIEDIEFERPNLEEAFLEYYGSKEDSK